MYLHWQSCTLRNKDFKTILNSYSTTTGEIIADIPNVFPCILFWYWIFHLAPTGSACGTMLYYMRSPVFSCVCDYRNHLVVRAISLTLKLLEFLRCDAPVSSTLAWWQRLLTHVSESLRTVSLIQATTSLPILWSIEWTLTSHYFHLKESIASPFLLVTSWILIELQSSGPSQRTKPLLHSKLGDRICNIPFLSMLILPRF